MIMKRTILKITLTALIATMACTGSSAVFAGSETQKDSRPNIIFILTDDQSPFPIVQERCDQSRPFGFNGDRHVHTPVIDSLAKNGLIFSRAYVSSSVCSPSRYATLTGRYAGRCRGPRFMNLHPDGTQSRVENNTELEEHLPNVARGLQQAGYRTGFVGKCHIIDHYLLEKDNWEKNGLKTYGVKADPRVPGSTAAMGHNHEYWINRIHEFGFDYVNSVYAANLRELYNEDVNVHNVEWKTKAVLNFIETSDDKPFFMYYSETIPHGPAPWISQNGKYVYGLDANLNYTGEGYVECDYGFMPDRRRILAEVAQKGKDPGHAWLRWFDYAVGAIVDKLKEKGKLENTLLILTSDHGNYNFGKATLYESGVRVPLMMHWPAGIKAGSVYDELVQNIDFAPTFLDLAGVKPERSMGIDGVSLKKVLLGNREPVHDHLFFELGYARGIMTKNWKYIAVRYDEKTQKLIEKGHQFDGWQGRKLALPYYVRNQHLGYHSGIYHPHYFEQDQLFDLRNDPEEKENVFTSRRQKAAEMKQILSRKLKTFPKRPFGELTAAEADFIAAGNSVQRQKNVLFIIVEDLKNAMGCYGNPLVKTPNLDRLASKGLIFDRAYCQYPVCNPSRSSFLTGLRPDTTQILENQTPWSENVKNHTTLPKLFRDNGYYTVSLGKIFHGRDDKHDDIEAWDINLDYDATEVGKRGKGRNMTDGKIRWCRWLAAEGTDEDQPDGQLAAKAVEILRESRNKPFFMAIGFHKPHDPFHAPKEYFDLYPLTTLMPPVVPENHSPKKDYIIGSNWASVFKEFSLQDQREFLRSYYACVSFIDAQIGRVMDELDRQDLWKDTVVIFVGDHGYNLGEHYWWNKAVLLEDSARIPMIAVVEGETRPNTRCHRFVEMVDLYPTFADVCGLQDPVNLEGISFRPLLQDPTRSWKTAAFTQVQRGDIAGKSIRTKRWRYNEWTRDGEVLFTELYDHASDPDEYRNLAGIEDFQDICKALSQRLKTGHNQF